MYDACRLGGPAVEYNDLRTLDPFRLASWAPAASAPQRAYEEAIAGIPEGGWLILQFHSFDDEGWEPLSRETFRSLCEIIERHSDVRVATVAQVIAQTRAAAPTLAEPERGLL
jgi:hypothetical protein